MPRILLLLLLLSSGLPAASDGGAPLISNSAAIPPVQPMVLNDPVPVPETLGASMAAGVGFLIMFRRRRLSR